MECESGTEYTTETKARQGVERFILEGRGNALTGRDISRLAGVPLRRITKDIQAARRNGSLIIAATDSRNPGYYTTADTNEARRYIQDLYQRAAETKGTADCMLAAVVAIEGVRG